MPKVTLSGGRVEKVTNFIVALMIFKVEMELLYFQILGSYNWVEQCIHCISYSKVTTYLKLEILGFVRLFYNNMIFFFVVFLPGIQTWVVNFNYTKKVKLNKVRK